MLLLPFAPPAALLQNPHDPYLAVPPGWRTVYSHSGDPKNPNAPRPKVGEIRVPPYGSGVEPAADVHRRDPKALYVATFLGGRTVEAALAADGTLTVSFGRREPHEHASDSAVSYDTKVVDAYGTAVAVGAILTRFDAPGRDPNLSQLPKRSPNAPASLQPVPGDPFASRVSLPEGYVHRGKPSEPGAIGSFASKSGPTLSIFLGWVPAHLPRTKDGVIEHDWYTILPVLGGTLSVLGQGTRTVAARFDPSQKGSAPSHGPTFNVLAATPQATLTAIFAALTYAPPKA